MIPLVRDHFRDGRLAPALEQRRLRQHQGVRPGLAVAPVRRRHCDRHDGLGVQVHRVFGLVGQMRGVVLQLRDAGVRVMRVFSMFIGHLLARPGAGEPLQVGIGRFGEAFGPGQRAQVGLPVGPGVLAHDALHRRIGLQRRGVHANGGATQQALVPQLAQHPVEDGVEHRLGQALTEDGLRGVDRRRCRKRHAQERPQGEAVGAAPGDAAHQLRRGDEEFHLPCLASSQCHAPGGRAHTQTRYAEK